MINKEPTFLVEENKLDPELGLTNEKKAEVENTLKLQFGDEAMKSTLSNTMNIYPENKIKICHDTTPYWKFIDQSAESRVLLVFFR